MVRVRPFAALRPPKELVREVASRPYDVMNSVEARSEAGEKSLLHITRPEIDFDPVAGEHEDRTYRKAVDNLRLAGTQMARAGPETLLLYICADDGKEDAVRFRALRPSRRLYERRHQEARTHAQGQGG